MDAISASAASSADMVLACSTPTAGGFGGTTIASFCCRCTYSDHARAFAAVEMTTSCGRERDTYD
jgi:hypothetical protein